MCHSKRIGNILLRLDYFGIIMHIGGNFVIGHYYFWFCQWTWQRVYLSIIPALYAAGTVLPMLDCFLSPHRRRLKMVLFGLVGVACFGPIAHWAVVRISSSLLFIILLFSV